MPNPMVSIVMATYNGEKFLREQIESILSQSYYPFEFIVFDDCSTDGTPGILEVYQNQGKLRFFRNESNIGYVRNFEKAIYAAQGDLIALADQDDVWIPSKLDRLTRQIGQHLLIHSDARLIDENGVKLDCSLEESARKMTIPQNMTEAILNGFVTGCTCLFKRQLLDLALPFPDKLYIHDKWLGVLAFSKGGLTYLKEPLTDYRQHVQNNIGAGKPTVSLFKKIGKLLPWKQVTYQFEAFRAFLEKEKKFTELVQERLKIESKEVSRLIVFFDQVLSGKSLSRVIFFYLRNIGAFEKRKSISQKVYFFYLIILSFFYSRKLLKLKTTIASHQ
ncbi:glycosyltransferase family 2 protein [Algoriphagus antarcticus]|uniref:Glycosyltransferase involved in cell wall biosynthesis n=1 Tax=Algoriphagus antarcticus TaxID=238540 RepID=A0A3E0DZW9_9BACT|nr:glycosyltransferase family 2 protein [Algoriphagus antarcticus]REG91485.1 glycosyltransferase involved in cell wall biosynthesis [Algoriphagus antarcticus]